MHKQTTVRTKATNHKRVAARGQGPAEVLMPHDLLIGLFTSLEQIKDLLSDISIVQHAIVCALEGKPEVEV